MQLVPVTQMLKAAEKGGYGIGSFSARNTYLIDAVLKGAQETKAPVIVQISANEFNWFDVTAKEFADRFYEAEEKIVQRKADRRRKLYNGRLEVCYYQFHGQKPGK